MMQKAFFFDGSRCNGCKACVMACSDTKDLPAERRFARVYEYEGSEGWTVDEKGCPVADGIFCYFVRTACSHCDNPVCVKNCPVGAMTKDDETGFVTVDQEKCVGCATCVNSCPYGAPVIDTEIGKSSKCDGCAERVAEGKLPVCVEACPMRALSFGDAKDIPDGYERAEIAPLPKAGETSPNLYIKPTKSARKSGSGDGWVSNMAEIG